MSTMIASCRHKRFEDNLGLVADFVLRYYPPAGGTPLEDTEEYSLGCLGLWKACQTFQVKQGNKFSTYAYHCIRNSIINGYRKDSRSLPTVDPAEIDDKNCSRGDVQPNVQQLLDEFLGDRTEDKPKDKVDRQMLVMYYLDGMTLEEIGKQFKVTKNRVRQRVGRAINLIRQRYRNLIESEQNGKEFSTY